MSEYRDIQTAVRVEKFRIWFAWVTGNIIMLIIALATQHVRIVSVITQTLLVVGFLLLTVTAVRMSNALNRKAEAARKNVIGDV